MRTLSDKVCLLMASGFYVGYIPGARGTYASALTVFFYWLAGGHLVSGLMVALFLMGLFVVAVFTSGRAAATENDHDPKFVVIDEVIGQLVGLFFVPAKIWNLLVAFILFRFFDIVKPFPIRRLETLRGGWGIVMDDVGAGLYTNLILHILMRGIL